MNGEKQLLRDKDIEPTNEVIFECLGVANDTYRNFTSEMKKRDITLEWSYYTDGMAWLCKGMIRWTGVRGGAKEVCVFWLSIWDGFFRVTFYVPEKYRSAALTLPLSDNTKGMIEKADPIGKLKFFPLVFNLESHERLADIYVLIDFKKRIK